MLITRYCNVIGTANIPEAHTKTCLNTPDVCFPLPSFRRAQYTCARNVRLARETGLGVGTSTAITSSISNVSLATWTKCRKMRYIETQCCNYWKGAEKLEMLDF